MLIYSFLRFFLRVHYDSRSYSAAQIGVGQRGQRRRITMRHHPTDTDRLREHGALVQRHRWDTSLQVTFSRHSIPFLLSRPDKGRSKLLYPNPVYVICRNTMDRIYKCIFFFSLFCFGRAKCTIKV